MALYNVLYVSTCHVAAHVCSCLLILYHRILCDRTLVNLWALFQNLQLSNETWASLSVLFYIPAFSCSQDRRWPVAVPYVRLARVYWLHPLDWYKPFLLKSLFHRWGKILSLTDMETVDIFVCCPLPCLHNCCNRSDSDFIQLLLVDELWYFLLESCHVLQMFLIACQSR